MGVQSYDMDKLVHYRVPGVWVHVKDSKVHQVQQRGHGQGTPDHQGEQVSNDKPMKVIKIYISTYKLLWLISNQLRFSGPNRSSAYST